MLKILFNNLSQELFVYKNIEFKIKSWKMKESLKIIETILVNSLNASKNVKIINK